MEDKCCGNCIHNKCEKNDTFICINAESEYYADYTDYYDKCEFWEGK